MKREESRSGIEPTSSSLINYHPDALPLGYNCLTTDSLSVTRGLYFVFEEGHYYGEEVEGGGGGGIRTSDSTTSLRGYNLTYSRFKTEETDRQTETERQRENLTSDASGL